jgi:hypothetical protein
LEKNLGLFFSNSVSKSSLKNICEILNYFLGLNKKGENMAEDLGLNESKVSGMMSLVINKSLKNVPNLDLIFGDLKLSKGDKKIVK